MKVNEVKIDVQKGALRLRGKIDNRYVTFIHFTFSSIVFIWLMTTMCLLVRVCIWVLSFYKRDALGALMGFL